MAVLIRDLKSLYDRCLESGDPRVLEFPLMGSPIPLLVIVVLYNYFSRSLGPRLMENRPPFELKGIMIVYNVFVVLLNSWFFWSGMSVWLTGQYHLYKQPVDYSLDPFAVHMCRMVYYFFLSKLLDMLDTVFMVLRKKTNQVSFLHTYHHSATAIVIWMSVKYIAGGSPIIVGTVNALVHVVMYSYYLLTLINPEYKKSVWWKKHLTEFQMIQFVFLAVVGTLIGYHSDNLMIKVQTYLCVPQNILFFFMFLDFYKNTYLKKKTDISKEK